MNLYRLRELANLTARTRACREVHELAVMSVANMRSGLLRAQIFAAMALCYIVLLLQVLFCNSYKFLVYMPSFGYSHLRFMGEIADTLTEAGHDVTVVTPIMEPDLKDETGVRLTKKVIRIPIDPRTEEIARRKADMVSKIWSLKPSVTAMLEIAEDVAKSFTYQCEKVFNDDALLDQLIKSKFDLGIAEAFDICGFGIFEIVGVPATIATFSGVHAETVIEAIGEPLLPSYVPAATSSAGDRMNFFERILNLADTMIQKWFFSNIYEKEIAAFRKKFGFHFKGYKDLLAEVSYVFTNSNPYLDFPRPMLHKTVPIGGITVSIDPEKNKLSMKWNALLNECKTSVLISFGSVSKTVYMPDEYKQSLLTLFKNMPNTTFIVKFEEENSIFAKHLPNVHLSSWLPQNALLADPRLTTFITHGGLGSVTELAYQGKPAILIPTFAEQPKNSRMLAKHGGGVVLSKTDLLDPKKLEETLLMIFNDARYSQNAKRLSEMLRHQPIKPKKLVLRYCEFAARFKRLPNLDPYGRQLSFVQYYLIDVILVIAAALTVLVIFIFIITKACRKHCFTSSKAKTE